MSRRDGTSKKSFEKYLDFGNYSMTNNREPLLFRIASALASYDGSMPFAIKYT